MVAEVKTVKRGQWSYTAAILKEHGDYDIWIKGEQVHVLLVSVPGRGHTMPKLNPDNHRFAKPVEGANKSAEGQKRLETYLNDLPAAGRLGDALDFNAGGDPSKGGLNEPLYLWNNTFVEGNRRAAHLRGKVEEILVVLLPDELTEQQIELFLSTKHLVGPEEWPSFVQSQMAWRFRFVHEMDWDDVRKQCQFNSIQAAKKYVGAYVWYQKYQERYHDDDITQWSKFHHAYVPVLISHFGYNPDTQLFDDPNVLAASKTRMKADEIVGKATDFWWFCNLIKQGRITDCRESDGLIGSALRAAGEDEEFADRVLRTLTEAPVPDWARTASGRNAVSDGKGRTSKRALNQKIKAESRKPTTAKSPNVKNGKTKEMTPGMIAWKQMREAKQEGFLQKKCEELKADVKFIMAVAKRRAPYQELTRDNQRLRTEVEALVTELEGLIDILPQKARKAS